MTHNTKSGVLILSFILAGLVASQNAIAEKPKTSDGNCYNGKVLIHAGPCDSRDGVSKLIFKNNSSNTNAPTQK